MSTFNTLNSGARMYYSFLMILNLFISIILLIGGLKVSNHKKKRNKNKTGKIIEFTECNKYTKKNKSGNSSSYSTMYKCKFVYEFNVNGASYTNNVTTDSTTKYRLNQSIKIEYDPNDPTDNAIYKIPIKIFAYILYGLSIFCLFTSIWYYFVSTTRGMGVAQGAINLKNALL